MEETKEENNFNVPSYIVVDSTIYVDKRLSSTDKILYGLIVALSNNQKRICYASNCYLAQVLNLKTREIQYCIKHLRDFSYINVTFKNNNVRLIQTTINKSVIERNNENGVNDNINPLWFNQDIESQIASQEDQDAMREMLNQIVDN